VAKGSNFERLISTRLSLWWTDGKHDDTIWRSSMSGGRATVRGRKGKRTAGHAGDLCSTDPASAALLRVLSFELKCGYHQVTINDLIDRRANAAFQSSGWDGWVHQADESTRLSGAMSWCLIHHRNRASGGKRTMAYFESDGLERVWPTVWDDTAHLTSVTIDGRVRVADDKRMRAVSLVGFRFDDVFPDPDKGRPSVSPFRTAIRRFTKTKR